MFAAVSFDSKTTLWGQRKTSDGSPSSRTFELLDTLTGHENEVKCAAWSPDGELLATCSRDKSSFVYHVEDKDEAAETNHRQSIESTCHSDEKSHKPSISITHEVVGVLQGHTQDVKFVLFPPDRSDTLVTCSYDDSVRIWQEQGDEWECMQTLRGHTGTVWAASFDKKGERLVTCSGDGSLRLWLTASKSVPKWLLVSAVVRGAYASEGWRCVATLQGVHAREILDVDWRKIGEEELIATACADNCVRVIQIENNSFRVVTTFRLPTQVNAVRWHPKDAQLLAVSSDDGLARVMRLTIS